MITNTSQPVDYRVNPKENFYFAVKIFFSIIVYYALIVFITETINDINPNTKAIKLVFSFYAGILILFLLMRFILIVGYLRGNAIKVSQRQFPDIYNIIVKQAERLGMSGVPDTYILQSGGVLNAFATRFFGTNYIVIYSDVLAAAYEQNTKVVEFIIGHEMGHIKRKHIIKRMLLLPSVFIPFLGPAYSRACEYTCDSIGYALCPEGAKPGMLLLAAGRGLFNKINSQAFIEQIETERSFTQWFSEKLASHPNLTKRIAAFPEIAAPVASNSVYRPDDPIVDDNAQKTSDHKRFMPY